MAGTSPPNIILLESLERRYGGSRMSRSRFLRTVRKQDFYKPMLRALAEAGVHEFEILPPTDLGHPVLILQAATTQSW